MQVELFDSNKIVYWNNGEAESDLNIWLTRIKFDYNELLQVPEVILAKDSQLYACKVALIRSFDCWQFDENVSEDQLNIIYDEYFIKAHPYKYIDSIEKVITLADKYDLGAVMAAVSNELLENSETLIQIIKLAQNSLQLTRILKNPRSFDTVKISLLKHQEIIEAIFDLLIQINDNKSEIFLECAKLRYQKNVAVLTFKKNTDIFLHHM